MVAEAESRRRKKGSTPTSAKKTLKVSHFNILLQLILFSIYVKCYFFPLRSGRMTMTLQTSMSTHHYIQFRKRLSKPCLHTYLRYVCSGVHSLSHEPGWALPLPLVWCLPRLPFVQRALSVGSGSGTVSSSGRGVNVTVFSVLLRLDFLGFLILRVDRAI